MTKQGTTFTYHQSRTTCLRLVFHLVSLQLTVQYSSQENRDHTGIHVCIHSVAKFSGPVKKNLRRENVVTTLWKRLWHTELLRKITILNNSEQLVRNRQGTVYQFQHI